MGKTTHKIISNQFETYCRCAGLTIDQSHFNDAHKYIVAIPGSVFLAAADARIGKKWAVMRNGENGTTHLLHDYMTADQLFGFFDCLLRYEIYDKLK